LLGSCVAAGVGLPRGRLPSVLAAPPGLLAGRPPVRPRAPRSALVPPLCACPQAWASGVSWQDIMAGCNLDDGDMARLLARTVDMLKQISHNDALLPYLRDPARAAFQAMNRKPIADMLL